ncbi:MAG: hypothetical protein QNJ51_12850 [Calothrix sp. MO_167.B12]|nr:hypothetical protein [Calothrix sp. MO_167.B12]
MSDTNTISPMTQPETTNNSEPTTVSMIQPGTINTSEPTTVSMIQPATINTSKPTTSHQHQSKPMKAGANAFSRNWKTTAIGIILSFTGFVAFSPSSFGGEQAVFVQFCKYITSGGLAVLGISSTDFNSNEDK